MDLSAAGAPGRLPVWQKIVSTIFPALCREWSWRSLGKRRKKRTVPAGVFSRRDSWSTGPQGAPELDFSAAAAVTPASPAPPAIPSTGRRWASASSPQRPLSSVSALRRNLRPLPCASSPHRARSAYAPAGTPERGLAPQLPVISAPPIPPATPSTGRRWASASSPQSPLSSVFALRRNLRPLPCASSPHRTRFAYAPAGTPERGLAPQLPVISAPPIPPATPSTGRRWASASPRGGRGPRTPPWARPADSSA